MSITGVSEEILSVLKLSTYWKLLLPEGLLAGNLLKGYIIHS
jgi:hypothetical protein